MAGRKFVASTTYLALLAIPLLAFGMVFSTTLVQVLYGPEYLEAGPALALCLVGTVMTAMTHGASSLLISADRQRTVLLVVIGCGVLKLGLDWSLIHLAGLRGAVAAFVLVCAVQAIALGTLAIRSSGRSPEWGRLSRIVLSAALAAAVVFPLQWQLVPIARLAIGGVLLGLAYLAFTLLLGCWSRGDIEHLQQIHQRWSAGRPRMGARLLAWAHHRASTEVAP